jgi:hypothetical protein
MTPQALLRFPGLEQVIRWSFTLSHGITPGVCQVDVAPQFGVPDEVGTLQLLFGAVRLEFPECVVDCATVRRSPAGMVVSLVLLDRRWKWSHGEISGRYNLRTRTGDLDPDTEKTPQELARLLLDALGESGAAVEELPNLARPEVDWDAASPAGELAALCESLGCRVVLGLDNRVALRRTGWGAPLPQLDAQRTVSIGIDPPARPDSLKLLAGPTRFQTQFRLQAVGEDRDGTIRPIDELAYTPAGGWGAEPFSHFPNISAADDRARALETVFRWYRILCTAPDETAGTFHLPGDQGPIQELWQILPLEPNLIETEPGIDGIQRPRPAFVEGIYWTGSADGENIAAARRYGGPFTLDTARGIVCFARPVVKRSSADGTLAPGELYLTIAHPLNDFETRKEVRFSSERVLPGPAQGTGPRVIRRDDLAETIISRYSTSHSPTDTITNRESLLAEAAATLDAAEAEFQTLETAQVEYAGLVPIAPDGAIHQIVWSGGPRGAVTRAGRNQEFSAFVPGWNERRARETSRRAVETSRRLARARERLLRNDR